MTNNDEQILIKELLEANKDVKLGVDKKEFLLTDEAVMERVIAGLLNDFKYL
ncbi:MAG: hypothetical protein ROO71_11370 [Balneola sp.]